MGSTVDSHYYLKPEIETKQMCIRFVIVRKALLHDAQNQPAFRKAPCNLQEHNLCLEKCAAIMHEGFQSTKRFAVEMQHGLQLPARLTAIMQHGIKGSDTKKFNEVID